jgi:hypothetical protein
MDDILDQLGNAEQGRELVEDRPASDAQKSYILTLLDTCILATCQTDWIYESLEDLTIQEASELIKQLKETQQNPLDRVKNGELLLASDLKIAVRKAVENPNT